MGFEDAVQGNEQEKQYSVEEAVMEIQMKIQEIAQMGNNDSEIPTLRDVIEKVKSGEMTPNEGVRIAYQTMHGKQDWAGGH